MKQALVLMILMASTLSQAEGRAPITWDIHHQDSYTQFSECKKNLENAVVALIGVDELSSSELLKMKSEIKFSQLKQIGARSAAATAAEGAQIYKLQGHLQFKNLYSAKFVLESGHGQCEIVQITLTQFP